MKHENTSAKVSLAETEVLVRTSQAIDDTRELLIALETAILPVVDHDLHLADLQKFDVISQRLSEVSAVLRRLSNAFDHPAAGSLINDAIHDIKLAALREFFLASDGTVHAQHRALSAKACTKQSRDSVR